MVGLQGMEGASITPAGDLEECITPESRAQATHAPGTLGMQNRMRQPSRQRSGPDEARRVCSGAGTFVGGAVGSSHRPHSPSKQAKRGGRDRGYSSNSVEGSVCREQRAAAVVRGQLRSELARAAQLCAECGFDEATGRLVIRRNAEETVASASARNEAGESRTADEASLSEPHISEDITSEFKYLIEDAKASCNANSKVLETEIGTSLLPLPVRPSGSEAALEWDNVNIDSIKDDIYPKPFGRPVICEAPEVTTSDTCQPDDSVQSPSPPLPTTRIEGSCCNEEILAVPEVVSATVANISNVSEQFSYEGDDNIETIIESPRKCVAFVEDDVGREQDSRYQGAEGLDCFSALAMSSPRLNEHSPEANPVMLESSTPKSARSSRMTSSGFSPKRRIAAAKARANSPRTLVPPLDVASVAHTSGTNSSKMVRDGSLSAARANNLCTPAQGNSGAGTARSHTTRMQTPRKTSPLCSERNERSLGKEQPSKRATSPSRRAASPATSPSRRATASRDKSPNRAWKGTQGQTVVTVAVDSAYYAVSYAKVQPLMDEHVSAAALPRWQVWSHGSSADFRVDKFSVKLLGIHYHQVNCLVLHSHQDGDHTKRWLVSCSADRVIAWNLEELWCLAKCEMVTTLDEDLLSKWPAVSVPLVVDEIASSLADAQVAVRVLDDTENVNRDICVAIGRGKQVSLYRCSSSLQSTCVVDVALDIAPRHLAITSSLHSQVLDFRDGAAIWTPYLNVWIAGSGDEKLWVCGVVDTRTPGSASISLSSHPLLASISVHCLGESVVAPNRCYVGGSRAIVQIFDASRPSGAGAVGKMHVTGESASVDSLCALPRDVNEILVALLADGAVFVQDVLSVGGEPVLDGNASRIFRAGLPTPSPDGKLIRALSIANMFAVFIAWVAPTKKSADNSAISLAYASVLAAPASPSARGETAKQENEDEPSVSTQCRFNAIPRVASRGGSSSFGVAGARRGYGDKNSTCGSDKNSSYSGQASNVKDKHSPQSRQIPTVRSLSKPRGSEVASQRVMGNHVRRFSSDLSGSDQYQDDASLCESARFPSRPISPMSARPCTVETPAEKLVRLKAARQAAEERLIAMTTKQQADHAARLACAAQNDTPAHVESYREQGSSGHHLPSSMATSASGQLAPASLAKLIGHCSLSLPAQHVVLKAGIDVGGALPENWRRAVTAGLSTPVAMVDASGSILDDLSRARAGSSPLPSRPVTQVQRSLLVRDPCSASSCVIGSGVSTPNPLGGMVVSSNNLSVQSGQLGTPRFPGQPCFGWTPSGGALTQASIAQKPATQGHSALSQVASPSVPTPVIAPKQIVQRSSIGQQPRVIFP